MACPRSRKSAPGKIGSRHPAGGSFASNQRESRMNKRIVIFADGTGNAFTRQESNIWRLYEAIDLTRPDQIAHYVRGVGTSSFRLWATIDAATGLGVPANVRRAYEYLCRNWRPDDEIYM